MQSNKLSRNEISLRLIRLYTVHVKQLLDESRHIEQDEQDVKDERRLFEILQTYENLLIRRSHSSAPDSDSLDEFKTAIRAAEDFLVQAIETQPDVMVGWFHGCEAANSMQHLCNVLAEIILELTVEVMRAESLFPGLKDFFDEERAEYRRMKEAKETEMHE